MKSIIEALREALKAARKAYKEARSPKPERKAFFTAEDRLKAEAARQARFEEWKRKAHSSGVTASNGITVDR